MHHLINHAIREGIKATDRYLHSSEFKQTVRKTFDAVKDPNQARANISKSLGLENCSRCKRQILKHEKILTYCCQFDSSHITICSKCLDRLRKSER